MAHPRNEVGRVMLDAHAAAAPIALLAPPEFTIDELFFDFNPGGKARDDSEQSLSMGLAGGAEAQHKRSILQECSIPTRRWRKPQKERPTESPAVLIFLLCS